MSSNFTVIYDACVLYPAPLRDLLMHLALICTGRVGRTGSTTSGRVTFCSNAWT